MHCQLQAQELNRATLKYRLPDLIIIISARTDDRIHLCIAWSILGSLGNGVPRVKNINNNIITLTISNAP